MPAERLIDELWGDEPPATATTALQVYISRLRKTLGEGAIETREPGYLVEGDVDVRRFDELVSSARRSEPPRAAELLSEALGLWRGDALCDCELPLEAARLEEQHVAAIEQRIEADLATGRSSELVAELESLVAEHPLREPFRAQLMLALYRAGRQAEALDSYRAARAHPPRRARDRAEPPPPAARAGDPPPGRLARGRGRADAHGDRPLPRPRDPGRGGGRRRPRARARRPRSSPRRPSASSAGSRTPCSPSTPTPTTRPTLHSVRASASRRSSETRCARGSASPPRRSRWASASKASPPCSLRGECAAAQPGEIVAGERTAASARAHAFRQRGDGYVLTT